MKTEDDCKRTKQIEMMIHFQSYTRLTLSASLQTQHDSYLHGNTRRVVAAFEAIGGNGEIRAKFR